MTKKARFLTKLKRIIASLILAVVLFTLLVNSYMILYANRYIYDTDELDSVPPRYAAMSLGAKVFSGGTLSHILRDRVITGTELYQKDKVQRLLFSGDHGQDEYDEVNAMMDYAVDSGVPESDIFLDHAGFSTYESMYRARDVFKCDELIIVTQRFHLYRSVYIARKLGIDAIGVCSDLTNYRRRTDVKNQVREYMARVKDFFIVEFFRPLPTYLGDPVPIAGDSDLSHDQ